MYFFYIDESGTRDPSVSITSEGGTVRQKEPIYVLLAVGLFEGRWGRFDRDIANLKLELADHLRRLHGLTLTLADCEVKSVTLRHPKEREGKSPFLAALSEADRTHVSETFLRQIEDHNMPVFAVVIDKRKLLPHMTAELLHKKAYELLLERIEHYLAEYHDRHNGLIVIDEVGYIPFEPEAANLFFQLVSSRYERASLIVTSNKPFGRWGEVFGDDVVAAAMIDRLVHHAEVIALRGDSYRLKDRDLGRVPAATTTKQT